MALGSKPSEFLLLLFLFQSFLYSCQIQLIVVQDYFRQDILRKLSRKDYDI